MPEFTNSQQRIMDILKDGFPHSINELKVDELDSVSAVRMHISALRKKLRPLGEDILCEFVRRRTLYRYVRLISVE